MAVPNFGQMKDMYQLQKKAKQMQKELKNLEIEARSTDGLVSVVVSGEMKIVSVSIDEAMMSPEKKRELEQSLKDVAGQAMAKAQTESAARMQPMLKDLNFPGM
jgi:DNA-binding YbaB/EbfC family protein